MQVNITLRKIENPKAGVDSVYAAGVQHDATLNAEESAPSISAYLKVTPAQFKAAWRALAAGQPVDGRRGVPRGGLDQGLVRHHDEPVEQVEKLPAGQRDRD